MKKLTLSEWASMGEIVGTVAIVVSLVFVVFSLNQNTAAIHGATENILFERHTDLANQFMLDPSLAEILVKMRGAAPQLTEIEAVRWEKYQLNLLDIWALAFNRYQRDLLASEQWTAWNTYFTDLFANGGEKLSKSRWDELEKAFDHEFWTHVAKSLYNTPE
jgi:hypothetical protein